MKELLKKLSAAQKLAAAAFLLGLLALIIGTPSNNHSVNVNAKEMLLSTIKTQDRVDVMTLADWLIKEKLDYTLVDLRSEKEFAAYNIPSSLNVPVENILTSDLRRNQKILLYGNDDVASAQAWFILKSSNYKSVYILDGGLNAWKDKILFPKLADNSTDEEKSTFEKVKQISLHFGGTPQLISGGTSSAVTPQSAQVQPMPKLSAPKSPAGGVAKKKKEGC